MRTGKTLLSLCAALGLVLSFNAPSFADEHEGCDPDPEKLEQTGTFTASTTSIGLLVGARWGDGVLKLPNGEEHKFDIFGMKALETGAASNELEGEVYNLKKLEDFPGTYYGASTKLTVIAGKGEGVSNNARCVVIKFRSSGGGLQLSAPAPGGVEISFSD